MPLLQPGQPGFKPWVVYILKNADGLLYTGITNDLGKRVKTHNAGRGARYTKGKGPWEPVYTEPAESHGAALRREAAIKRLSRAQKLALISRPRSQTGP